MTGERLPWHGRLTVAGGISAIGCFTAMHLLMADVVNPLRQPVSAYALAAPGNVLFALGTLSLALSCLMLAVGGLAGVGGRHGLIRWLLIGAAAMLVVVVVFRTDAGDAVTSLSGQVHRYAAAVVFICLTITGIGMCVYSGAGRAAVVLTVLSAGVLLVIGVNTFAPALADSEAWRGLPQRILLAIQTALVVVLALAPRPAANRLPAPTSRQREWVNHRYGPPVGYQVETMIKPTQGQQLWLSGRGTESPGALPSGNGLRSSLVRRQ